MPAIQKTIYTIGHSTRSFAEFIEMLQSFSIEALADVRSFPGSRRYPHFNKENFESLLPEKNILYIHLPSLGGRRKSTPESKNFAWKNDAFRGYADYMETENFEKGIEHLESIALKYTTVYMCSEAVWWRCHRSMISDYMKVNTWKVMHIMGKNKISEHTYTSPAKIIDNKLSYAAPQKRLF